MEANPNHPVTQQMREQWHKIVALLLHKFDLGEVIITTDDLKALMVDYDGGMPAVVCHDKADGLHLRIVDEAEGLQLAKREGGLPS